MICTIRLSDVGEMSTNMWKGTSYRHAEIQDASGATVLTADNCIVPVEGNFAVTERANTFWVGHITVRQHDIIIRYPTKDVIAWNCIFANHNSYATF